MGIIKVEDLPEDMKISEEEMRKVFGGVISLPPLWSVLGGYPLADPRPSPLLMYGAKAPPD